MVWFNLPHSLPPFNVPPGIHLHQPTYRRRTFNPPLQYKHSSALTGYKSPPPKVIMAIWSILLSITLPATVYRYCYHYPVISWQVSNATGTPTLIRQRCHFHYGANHTSAYLHFIGRAVWQLPPYGW